MRSPVLFLVFNRPDTTRKVFEAIRAAQPPKLYVAADGPRKNRDGERERCDEARRIATAVDWPCELKTLFRDENLGCNLGPSMGISWLFENEEEGIILEDDVLPLSSFFPYCDELLERYRFNESVGLISGSNLISSRYSPVESYFYSQHTLIWGWASWRRAWKHYDGKMQAWPKWRDNGGLKTISSGNKSFELYWRNIFNLAFQGTTDIWDYQWTFCCWYHGMVSILPSCNQTNNIGFCTDAIHTTGDAPIYVKESIPTILTFPLYHPINIKCNVNADALINRYVYGNTFLKSIKNEISKIPLIRAVFMEVKKKYIHNIMSKK